MLKMVTILEIAGYAVLDAINPCALAVMAIVLMSLLLEDPTKRKKVLTGGLAFISAVFLLYLVYGILMVFVFNNIMPDAQWLAKYVFKAFGVFAIVLGLFNIKDYLNYKPGGFMREMPLSMRSPMKRIVSKIRTTSGAFIVGLFVTVFLLPCTIGPYVIASARLSVLSWTTIISWLFLYNLIFIFPMILITLFIYFGLTTVHKVSGWKDRNIKNLHLVEGAILIILGILIITGLI